MLVPLLPKPPFGTRPCPNCERDTQTQLFSAIYPRAQASPPPSETARVLLSLCKLGLTTKSSLTSAGTLQAFGERPSPGAGPEPHFWVPPGHAWAGFWGLFLSVLRPVCTPGPATKQPLALQDLPAAPAGSLAKLSEPGPPPPRAQIVLRLSGWRGGNGKEIWDLGRS